MTNPNYVHRKLEERLRKYLPLPEIIAIVGPRRVGKTTLLHQLEKSLSDCQYVTFENQVILDLFDLEIGSFAERYVKPNRNLIIDEFQHAKRGGKNLKYLYDTFPGKKIIISGSSSPDLTIKALKFLTGRCLVFTLLPFSYEEFLSTKPVRPTQGELKRHFAEFVTFGGYPEVVLQEDAEIKKMLLQNIYSLFFAREVSDLTTLSDDYKLKNLLRALALSIGNLTQYHELSQISGFDFLTLKKYLNFLAKTYIAFPVLPYFTNKRTEIVKNPKLYFYDLGLRNSLIDNFSPLESRVDKGAMVENFVAVALQSLEKPVRFWRTKNKAEVDFVLESEGKLTAVEVKAGREMSVPSSMRAFLEKYHPERALVLNGEVQQKRKVDGDQVEFVPFWQKGKFL